MPCQRSRSTGRRCAAPTSRSCRDNPWCWQVMAGPSFIAIEQSQLTSFFTIYYYGWSTGDGRNDSPGHSAQFCTYTLMELGTKSIVCMTTIDKRQTGLKSMPMEKMALETCLDILKTEVEIAEIVTDAHVQIAAFIRKIPSFVQSDKQ